MRTLLPIFVLALCASVPASGQAIRFDSTATTTSAQCVSGKQCPLLVLPGTQVNFCQGTPSTLSACLASPATTYRDASAGVACATTAQLTPGAGGSCLATADAQGGYGAWFLPGSYGYYLRVPVTAGGGTYGPYALSIHGDSGGYTFDSLYSTLAQACTAAGTGTLAITRAWNATPSQTLACSVWFLGDGKIQTATSAAVVFGSGFTCPSTQRCLDSSTNSGGSFTFTRAPGIYPQWWGAKCDGSADDTIAFQSAANTGNSLVVSGTSAYCKLTSPIHLTAVGQSVYGVGHTSKIVQSGTNENANVIVATSLGHNEFRNLYLVPGTLDTNQPLAYGWAIRYVSSDYGLFDGIEVSGHRHGAIQFYNASHNTVTGGFFHDSVVADGDIAADSGYDVHIFASAASASYNLVSNNQFKKGSGVACTVQTDHVGSSTAINNSCSNNIIDTEPLYGILFYRNASTDTVTGAVASNNTIKNVTGTVTIGGDHTAGTCIYATEEVEAVINGNQIDGCNVYQPPVLSLHPGCIGTSSHLISASGNRMRNCNTYGINQDVVVEAAAFPAGRSAWSDNIIYMPTGSSNCAFFKNVPYLVVNDLQCSAASQIADTAVSDINTLSQSLVHDFSNIHTANYAGGLIQSGTVGNTSVRGSYIKDNTSHGILATGTVSKIEGNTVVNGTGGDGIRLEASVTGGFVTHNTVSGGDTCFVNNQGANVLMDENSASGCGTTYLGSNGPYYSLGDSATPSVSGLRKLFIIPAGNVTGTITNFTSGVDGQELVIIAEKSVTIQYNANLILAGRTSFSMISGDTITFRRKTSSWLEVGRQSH